MRIAHASIDENGRISGGAAGNQTGKEICIRKWYNKPWSILLRHPDPTIREKIAETATILASSPVNSLIGYDQSNRNSLHQVAKACGYDIVEFINLHELCETDCSAFVTVVCLFAGVKALEYCGNAPTTSTMKTTFEKAGFRALTDQKYVGSDVYLSRGDILVKPSGHTVICLDNGPLFEQEAVEYYPRYTGYSTSIVQVLNELGIDSSKTNRRKIYRVNFQDTYVYSAQQNTAMIARLRNGTLIKPL